MLFDPFSEIKIHEDAKIYVQIDLIYGKERFPVIGLLDTGATGTMLPRWVAEDLGIKYNAGKERFVNGISGRLKGMAHRIETVLINDSGDEVGRNAIDITFVDGSDLALVGMNLITKFDWELLFSEKIIKVGSI
ncbi:MAG: aspartyl protease family protein [Kiritimatiellales bacterium]